MKIIDLIKNGLRHNTINHRLSKLKNRDFTIISNNCCGSLIYQLLGMKYTSPTVGVIIDKNYFFKLCYYLRDYCSVDMQELNSEEENNKKYNYSAGIIKNINGLDDIVVYFPHERSSKEAIRKWNYRKNRINYQNLYIIYDTHMYIAPDDYEDFYRIQCKNKVMFTEKTNINSPNTFSFSCYKKDVYYSGILFKEIIKLPFIYTKMDEFDFVNWLNTSTIGFNRKIRKD